MKEGRLFVILGVVLLAGAVGCATATDVSKASDPSAAYVNMQNEQLAKLPVSGFEYKSAAVPPQSWDKWAKVAAPVVKEVINKLPEGYVLQVTGHTDSRGPETAYGAKPGNMKISTDRARAVYNSLKKQGITSPRMTYKGVGSSEPLSGVDSADPQQRRVTFKVVPK